MSDTPSPANRVSSPLVTALRERYEILRETGRGASAIVYLARDLKHERLVALKTLNPDVGPVAGERFLREIQVSAGMQHPHILPTYDSGVADGRLYFVMPFVDGGSLRQRLDAEPQLPIAEALQCAHDIALALAFAHDQGVVHRDIKPENILFYHGHACLADFGVARVMQELDVRVTGHGMVVGTPAYMSPEQLTDGGFDGRSDVYSLACVLYEMLAGVHAFSGSTPRELLQKRLRTPPEPLHRHRPDVPPFVEDLLIRALAAAPDGRYVDARAFADAIEFAIRDLTAPKRISGPMRAIESVPRHPLAWAGSVALIVALGALAATPLRTVVKNRSSGSLEAATGSAKESYGAGKKALDKWDLANAEKELSRAATAAPKMAMAQLKLAQTLELERRVDSDPFRLAAARLAAARPSLHGRDSLLAEAMIAFAARAYPRACDAFGAMRAADSLDAMAWYGLGDCQALDSTVVADAKSASRYRFRSSWNAAVHAYVRAATIDPAMHRAVSYSTLAGVLPSMALQIRIGHSDEPNPTMFAAHPALVGDTIAYVPYTFAVFGDTRTDVNPLSQPDALRRNSSTLVSFARQWIAAEPSNPDAFEALASGLEARDQLSVDGDGAGAAIRRARTLAVSPDQRLRLGASDVRLRVKRREFASASKLADSLLDADASSKALTPDDADRLAGLAALTGRVELAASLHSRASSSENAAMGIAPQVTAVASRLFARAAAGVCDDSLVILREDVDKLLESYSEPTKRAETRAQAIGRSMSLAFPCLRGRAFDGLPPTLPLDRAQRAFAAGDRQSARNILDAVAKLRRISRPGDISMDFTVQEAWLRLAMGDTASALRQLDLVLNAFPTLGPYAVREEAQSAAIGRALTLRAEIAAARGDVAVRQRRASEALMLLDHADPSMRAALIRLRALASVTR